MMLVQVPAERWESWHGPKTPLALLDLDVSGLAALGLTTYEPSSEEGVACESVVILPSGTLMALVYTYGAQDVPGVEVYQAGTGSEDELVDEFLRESDLDRNKVIWIHGQ